MTREQFLYCIQHAREAFDGIIHMILGDVNIDALTNSENFLSQYLIDYERINDKPTHISGSLIDHVYIHESVREKFQFSSDIHSVYFTDHDAVMVKLENK